METSALSHQFKPFGEHAGFVAVLVMLTSCTPGVSPAEPSGSGPASVSIAVLPSEPVPEGFSTLQAVVQVGASEIRFLSLGTSDLGPLTGVFQCVVDDSPVLEGSLQRPVEGLPRWEYSGGIVEIGDNELVCQFEVEEGEEPVTVSFARKRPSADCRVEEQIIEFNAGPYRCEGSAERGWVSAEGPVALRSTALEGSPVRIGVENRCAVVIEARVDASETDKAWATVRSGSQEAVGGLDVFAPRLVWVRSLGESSTPDPISFETADRGEITTFAVFGGSADLVVVIEGDNCPK